MIEILRYMIEQCAFLFDPGRYRFVDSLIAPSFGGDAYVVLSGDSVRLQFVRDRGQLSLEFQPATTKDASIWFSIDLIQRLLTGERQDTAELTPETGAFLRAHIEEIERRLAPENVDDTVAELDRLKTLRAKELFG
jgi:hypothetical protein